MTFLVIAPLEIPDEKKLHVPPYIYSISFCFFSQCDQNISSNYLSLAQIIKELPKYSNDQ